MIEQAIARREFPSGQVFEVVIHDLLDETTDAIVNAANGGLAHGGGVAAAIARAAGPELERDGERIIRERGRIPVGEAVVTVAGALGFLAVIHCVGPQQGDPDASRKLESAVTAACLRAHERGFGSLSFPAISSGIFAVPPGVCAPAYVRAVQRFFAGYPASSLRTIRLVLFPGPIVDAVRTALAEA